MTSVPMCLAVTQASRVSFINIRFMIKFQSLECVTLVYPSEAALHVAGVAAADLPRPVHQPGVVETVRGAGTGLQTGVGIIKKSL